MARKTAQSFAELPVINFGDEEGSLGKGEEFQGYYKGKRLVKTKYKDQTPIYTFQTEAGDVNIWGSTNLNQKMDQVQLGSLTFITYTGLKKSQERGKQPMKLFNVDYDDEDTIHVDVPKVSFQNDEPAADDQDDGPDAEDMNDDGDVEDDVDQEPKQVASTRTAAPKTSAKTGNAAAAASTKDKLAAMLNKGGQKRPAA